MIHMANNGKIFKLPVGKNGTAPKKQPEHARTDTPDTAEHPALQETPAPRVSKKLYKIAAILLAAIVLLLVLENWQNLSPANIGNWIRTKAVGLGFGDGYPVDLVGSTADPGNFGTNGGNVYVVSDTALTVMNSSAKTLFTARHSYNNPAVSVASDRYLLYNMGGNGYQIETVSGTQVSGTSENGSITVGAIANSGKFALALQPVDKASQLCVYNRDGSLQYQYDFADMYINAIALNSDGTRGAVAAVTSRSGSLVTCITVLDFSETEPIASYEIENNLVLGLLWTNNNRILAIGDQAAFVSDGSFTFSSCDYGGREVTAFCLTESRAIVSVSNYAYGGDSTLLIFSNSAEPVEAELSGRATALCAAGSKVSALLSDRVVAADLMTGRVEYYCESSSDTKGIAMADEGSVYMLGVREIRKENLKGIPVEEELSSAP